MNTNIKFIIYVVLIAVVPSTAFFFFPAFSHLKVALFSTFFAGLAQLGAIGRYLTTEGPLHTLAKEGLRNNLSEAFLEDLSQREHVLVNS